MLPMLADISIPTDGIFSEGLIVLVVCVLIVAAVAIAIWQNVPKWVLVLVAIIITLLIIGNK